MAGSARRRATTGGSRTPYHRDNSRGRRYFLHGKMTRKGHPSYFFAMEAGPEAIADFPEGWEVNEAPNGNLHMRKVRPPEITAPGDDVVAVQSLLDRVAHRLGFVARAEGTTILILEPHPRPELLAYQDRGARASGRARFAAGERATYVTYVAVAKLEPHDDGYALCKRVRGIPDTWSYPLDRGSARQLALRIAMQLGTDDLYRLV